MEIPKWCRGFQPGDPDMKVLVCQSSFKGRILLISVLYEQSCSWEG